VGREIMKLFISYKFTGEDPSLLKEGLGGICSAISDAGHTTFCNYNSENLYQESKFTVKQIMEHALQELDQCDTLLAWMNSDNRSEGMLIEIGYAKAKGKKIILAIREGVNAHSSRGVADTVIEYSDLSDLFESLKTHKFDLLDQ
jgi:nucleoside 2-deoxyribosyltransferase